MKIAVIGANGQAGKLIVKELITRGYNVTAIVRRQGLTLETPNIIVKNLFDLTYDDLRSFDVIINAFGVWKPEEVNQFTKANDHLCNLLTNKENRLLIVGSAGSLYVDDALNVMFIDTPEMPEVAIPVATEQANVLFNLRTRNDILWTYMSPPVDFRVNGERTGMYKLSRDRLILDSNGESQISYADAAVAIVDEIENKNYIRARFSVVAA